MASDGATKHQVHTKSREMKGGLWDKGYWYLVCLVFGLAVLASIGHVYAS